MKDAALNTAGAIFTLVAGVHLLQLIFGFEILIDGQPVPVAWSFAPMVIAAGLSVWKFVEAWWVRGNPKTSWVPFLISGPTGGTFFQLESPPSNDQREPIGEPKM
ncbi:MAG: hypothetical protein HQL52_20195 [Magnetococcales bacterium]|nr:hypothetical protein [Magnetococcales bacterium]